MLTLLTNCILGDLPGDWKTQPLRELLVANYPGNWGTDSGTNVVRVLRSTNLTNNGMLDLSDIAQRYLDPVDAAPLQPKCGDILLERSGGGPGQPVGRVGFVDRDLPGFAFSNFLHLLRPNDDRVNGKFLGWYLYQVNRSGRIVKLEQQTTQLRNLHFRDYLTQPIPIPTPEEQSQIAATLDAVDAAIERARDWLNLANRLRSGLLRQLLTYGFSSSCETWRSRFGPIPTHWNCVQLGSVIADGPTNGIYRPLSDYGGKGVPIVRITDFDSGCTKLPSSLRRLLIGPADASRYELRNGDIVINRVNSLSHIGKSMLVSGIKEPTVFESNMMRFRLRESILPEFLIQVLQSRSITQQIQTRAKPAVNQASINQSDVRRFWIPQPPVDEQFAIVKLLDSQTAVRTAVESRLSLLTALKRGLMQDLLTGKVRVSASLEVAGT